MTNFLKNFAADESGASAAEYALILVIIGVAIVVGATTLGGAIGQAMSDTADCIADPQTSSFC
ncbi:Flp family type IVb pilin [Allopontixanthobacter sp.]|uniref:Flp family type IVb pilin n=1 Tax=Allopontixanthobacter sp. TaxID=2906452 RepID=UPI002ABC10F4|nr:Flp family type IVb pilin [Allopontixanthobacter sp.]MDZ4307002.1 Flp family type IVb pilin [Allopontixanthobacter sp.]